jgi:hypothetical protein
VVKTEPDWNRLPEAIPPAIRTLLRRCMRKDKRQRLQDATGVRIEIEEALAAPHEVSLATTAAPATASWQRALLLSLGTLIVGAAIRALTVWNLKPAPAQPVTRLTLPLQAGEHLVPRQNVVRAKNRAIPRRVQLKMKRKLNQESSPTQRFSLPATCGRVQHTHIHIHTYIRI